MNRFLQKIFLFLKLGAALIAGGLYVWVITILLEDDNWVGISALTTMFLAIAAFWAIWQNYSFRKKDRKRLIKERALITVRNWANDALGLMTLNAQYTDEHKRSEFLYGNLTLEKIQVTKDKLLRGFEETLISAKLWPDLFTLVDEASYMLKEFIEKGMAERPNLTEQDRKDYGTKFASILPLTRQIEGKDPDFKI